MQICKSFSTPRHPCVIFSTREGLTIGWCGNPVSHIKGLSGEPTMEAFEPLPAELQFDSEVYRALKEMDLVGSLYEGN